MARPQWVQKKKHLLSRLTGRDSYERRLSAEAAAELPRKPRISRVPAFDQRRRRTSSTEG